MTRCALIAYTACLGVPITVVETPAFLRAADQVLDEEQRGNLVVFVAVNPEAGDVIPQTGGVRKLRWRPKEKASEAESE